MVHRDGPAFAQGFGRQSKKFNVEAKNDRGGEEDKMDAGVWTGAGA